MLNNEQELCLSLARNGHNIVILGQAGTGKTYTISHIIKLMKDNGKNVGVCSSTGISASHMSKYGAKTIHSWSCLEDGRYTDSELADLIQYDQKYVEAKNRDINA